MYHSAASYKVQGDIYIYLMYTHIHTYIYTYIPKCCMYEQYNSTAHTPYGFFR